MYGNQQPSQWQQQGSGWSSRNTYKR
jgi:hypothetical protein